MRRIKAALFVDFDNLLSNLLAADRASGLALANDPSTLIERLASLDDQVHRDVLVRRAYLNTAGSVPDPAPAPGGAHRIPLLRYRPNLVAAGFEVIDCPTLAKGMKNAADIRMVLDAIDAAADPVRYDEFVVASADADFTPLLTRLRAQDRRTMVIASRPISTAYRASTDRVIDEADLLTPTRPAPSAPAAPRPANANGDQRSATTTRGTAPARRAAAAIAEMAAQADGPLSLSSVGLRARAAAGSPVVDETKWFGRKTLTAFIRADVPSVAADRSHAWAHARVPASEQLLGDASAAGRPPAINRRR